MKPADASAAKHTRSEIVTIISARSRLQMSSLEKQIDNFVEGKKTLKDNMRAKSESLERFHKIRVFYIYKSHLDSKCS